MANKKIDLAKHPEIIALINAIINDKGICEIKIERRGVTVVEIKRTLKNKGE